jgi:hypothetical protein
MSSEKKSANPNVNSNFGKVPNYIVKRHQENHQKALRDEYNETLKMVPIGMKIVPHDERVETLQNLAEASKELINNLERFPIMSTNVSRSSFA